MPVAILMYWGLALKTRFVLKCDGRGCDLVWIFCPWFPGV